TNTTPATENVHVQLVQVGSGSVNVSGIKWGYKEGTAGVLSQIPSTGLTYKKTGSTVQNYIVEIDPSTMPSYMQVDASYGVNGFTAGYSGNDKTDANNAANPTYTATARLKITNTDFKFESTGSNGYTYVSDTEAEITFTWTINPKELDFTGIDWVFSSNATSETDTSATWTKFDATAQGGNPEYTGQGFIYIKIDDASMANLGLAVGDYSISYGNTNQQILAQTSTTTNAYITLSNPNYKLPSVATGAPNVTYTWQISNKQIYITGWGNNATISGSDGAGGNKAYTFPRVSIGNTDGTDYTQYLEYEYSYTVNGVSYTGRTEAQMIQDIFPVASVTNQISGTVTVKLTTAGAQTYDLNGTALSWPFSCGASKTMVTVSLTGTHVMYDDNGDFAISATYYPGNMTSLSQMDFIATNGAKLEITLTDKNGQVKVFTADHAGDADVLEFVKNAGTYTVDFVITDTALEGAYALSASQLNYVVARKEIVVPQVIKALTFNGNDVIFTDHLDNQYTANSSMIDVTGDTQCRNVSQGNAYSVTLKLNDENYCWVLPASSQTPTKGLAKITLVDDTVETNVSIPATDPTRAVYSWNVAPLAVDTSKSWKDGKLTLPAELQNLVNSGDVTIKYNYYNDAGELLGDSESGFEPQGGVSYRIEAVLEGQDADGGNVVFVSSDGSISGKTSDRVVYTAPKSGMAKFKDTLTKKVAGLPLWAWIVIGVCALILLIILICIIVAAAKKKKKKEEEKAAKAEKEEAKAAAAAAAAAPMLAMSASMADEKAKLEAERAKMEANLAKAKMEAEAEAAKAKAQAELDLQRAKTEAEIARMRAEAQHAAQPAPVQQPVQQPAPQPQYQQQPQPQYMPQPQPQYIPMPMPQPQYMMPQQQSSGSLSRLEEEFKAMRAEQRSDTKLENEMLKLRLDMSRGMPNQYGYVQNNQLPAGQQSNVSNGDVNLFAEKLGILMASMMRNMGVKAMPVPEKIEPQVIEAESQSGAVNTPTMYPPDAVITTTTTVDTTNRGKSINGSDRGEDPIFDIDGFYDKFDESK
ncbi:MAG: hypothetical protein K2G96_04570, partial [Clostridia bacterium]|nr:hypothetical protein [Clostridia bacterium]